MPELPDLVWVEKVLRQRLAGRQVAAARVGDPTVLRLMLPGEFSALVSARRLNAVERRGHFMRFALGPDRVLVVNAMLAGRYRVLSATERSAEKDPAALGFALTFEDGQELRYLDEKRMGKAYVAASGDEGRIPVYGDLGVDLLSPAFDRERFLALTKGRRDQVRMFLMDKRALASIGNAYADEILFAARLHPKTLVSRLSPEERDRLFVSIGAVLGRAIAEIERRAEPPDVKVRDFLAVRGRDGKPCPVCGTTIRAVRVGDGDACFCPHCQPATRALFVDWSRLPPSGTADPLPSPPPSPGAAGASASRLSGPRAGSGKAPRRRRSPR